MDGICNTPLLQSALDSLLLLLSLVVYKIYENNVSITQYDFVGERFYSGQYKIMVKVHTLLAVFNALGDHWESTRQVKLHLSSFSM